jgi:hypothetical protein
MWYLDVPQLRYENIFWLQVSETETLLMQEMNCSRHFAQYKPACAEETWLKWKFRVHSGRSPYRQYLCSNLPYFKMCVCRSPLAAYSSTRYAESE